MKPRQWTRLAIALWVLLLAVSCFRPIFRPMANTVYPIYAYAGADFAAGQQLYVSHPDTDVFRYSPLVAATFEPFSLLPMGFGGALWRAIGSALFLSGLAAWARHTCPDISLAGIYLLALPLSIGSLANGQANVHILGLMLWAAVLATRGRWGWAAVFIAAAALFKGYPLAFGLLVAVAAPIRHGVPLAGAMFVGFALPYLFQNPEYVTNQYWCWLHSVSHDDRCRFPLFAGYQDVHMLLRVIGANLSIAEFRLVQMSVGAVAAVVIARQIVMGLPRDRIVRNSFTIGICWMATFGPGVESSTFILLAPIAASVLLGSEVLPRWATAFAVAGGGLSLLSVMLFAFPHDVHQPIVAMGIQPLAALLISIAAVHPILAADLTRKKVRAALVISQNGVNSSSARSLVLGSHADLTRNRVDSMSGLPGCGVTGRQPGHAQRPD